jgi:1-acyl-sn-glycerol-3-phosphate acyltransferase
MNRANRKLVKLYQGYKWAVYYPLLGVSTAGLGLVAIGLSQLAGPSAGGICSFLWSRLNGYAIPMNVRVHGRENIAPGQSYVVVCNHQSNLDIFVVLGWLGLDVRWVMKAELRKVPVFGAACERLGYIYIDRKNRARALASLDAAREKIKDGVCIVFFPEGTRSPDGALQAFKKGAFHFATDLGLPLLPVTIRGTRDLLPGRSLELLPGSVDLFIHPPVATTGCGRDDFEPLSARVRERIAGPLGDPPGEPSILHPRVMAKAQVSRRLCAKFLRALRGEKSRVRGGGSGDSG